MQAEQQEKTRGLHSSAALRCVRYRLAERMFTGILLRVLLVVGLCCGAPAAAVGTANITVGPFALQLDPKSQVLSFLALSNDEDGFAFAHGTVSGAAVGDVKLRIRPASWPLKSRTQPKSFATLSPFPLYTGFRTSASAAVTPLPVSGISELAAADLTNSLLPEGNSCGAPAPPVSAFILQRRWARGADNTSLVLTFTVTNNATEAVEIGALGLSLPFPWSAGTAAGDKASTFVDPSIAGQHGFATVTRLSGKKEVLMITAGWTAHAGSAVGVPSKSPATAKTKTSLEAWQGSQSQGEWLCHSKAYANSEWSTSGKQWLEPTSAILQPKGSANGADTAEYSLVFSVATTVREKDAALTAAGNAIAVGVPGYILGADMTTAKLLVKAPTGAKVATVTSDESALVVGAFVPASAAGWTAIPLKAVSDGRPRLTIQYTDGSTQVISYRTIGESFADHIDRFSAYQASTTFFNGSTGDPFKRGPSMMPWDRELNQHVTDDPRTYVVGLSDDAGAGANVGYAAKLRYRPTQDELDRLDDYIEHTLWGAEPDGAGVPVSLQDQSTYGIKSSMFWSVTAGEINETGMPGYNYLPEVSASPFALLVCLPLQSAAF